MTLDTLTKLANQSGCKKGPRTHACGYPVKITKTKYKDGTIRLALDMYEEPKNCNFRQTAYWQVVWVPTLRRAYVIYSDSKKGYKVVHAESKIGRIAWTDHELTKALIEYSDDKCLLFNWKWDPECARAYIDLGGQN